MNIFIDTETLPTNLDWARQAIHEMDPPDRLVGYPKDMSREDKIALWRDKQFRATALDGGVGRLCVIGWALEDGEVQTVSTATGDSEAQMLSAWAALVEGQLEAAHRRAPHFIGFNVAFDIDFLWKRCIIHGLKLPFHLPHHATPWSGKYTDVRYLWWGAKPGHGTSQTRLCQELGIEDHDTISGADVWDCWQAGDYDTVIEHCRMDVDKVRQAWERLR